MLKQSPSKMKKILAVLLAVLFVVSLTAVSASAFQRHNMGGGMGMRGGFGHHGFGGGFGGGWGGGWGWPGWGWGWPYMGYGYPGMGYGYQQPMEQPMMQQEQPVVKEVVKEVVCCPPNSVKKYVK